MWNPEKFQKVLNIVVQEGTIIGLNKKVTTKEQIYEALGTKLGLEPGTVKRWSNPKSNGPGDNAYIVELEKLLGLSKGKLGRREEIVTVKKIKSQSIITDFNKMLIYECYKQMKDYLNSDDVESEERFSEMYNKISQCEVAIPAELFEKIKQFVDDNLAPIVYDRNETFNNCFTEGIGSFNESGSFCPHDEESTNKFCMNFMLVLFDIEQKVDGFAKTDLSPYLLG